MAVGRRLTCVRMLVMGGEMTVCRHDHARGVQGVMVGKGLVHYVRDHSGGGGPPMATPRGARQTERTGQVGMALLLSLSLSAWSPPSQ